MSEVKSYEGRDRFSQILDKVGNQVLTTVTKGDNHGKESTTGLSNKASGNSTKQRHNLEKFIDQAYERSNVNTNDGNDEGEVELDNDGTGADEGWQGDDEGGPEDGDGEGDGEGEGGEEDEQTEGDEDNGDSEEESGDEETGSDSEEKADSEKSKVVRKKAFSITTKDGEKVKLPPDSDIQVIVDGKVSLIPLSEVVNGYSGKLAIEKRIQDGQRLVNQAKIQTEELNAIRDNLNGIFQQIATPGKTYQALKTLVKQAGIDVREFEKNLIDEAVPLWHNLSQMSQVERENLYLKEELENRRSLESSAKVKTEADKTAEFKEKLGKYQAQYGFSDEDVYRTVNRVIELAKSGDLQRNGIPEPTPELVSDMLLREQADGRAEAILLALDKGLKSKLGNEAYQKERLRVGKLIFTDPSVDDEEILDSARILITKKLEGARKGANSKLAAKLPAKPTSKGQKQIRGGAQNAKSGKAAPVSFSDWLNIVRG